MIALAYLTVLTLASLLPVGWLLSQPSRAVDQPIFVPDPIAVPDLTFDHTGLV